MAQKYFSELTAAAQLNKTDVLPLEQQDGTKRTSFEAFCRAIMTPDITSTASKFPEIAVDDTLPVIVGKIKKWQQDAIEKIETYVLQSKIIQEFPEESFDPDNPDDPITVKLKSEVTSGLLAYIMNQNILAVTTDHGTLQADYAIMKREQMASYGYYGVEWDIDDLMALVKTGKWDKFAIGDTWVETTSANEQIRWEVTGKNSFLHCGDTELSVPHIVATPRDCLNTYYKFNASNTNAGGYAASLMPANLETEANKFSAKLQGYMTTIRRLENNKGTWAWASRRIMLPGIVELTGQKGFSDGFSGGAFNQLALFTGGNAHLLKGAGDNKGKAARMWYWTADPSAGDATYFCYFGDGGYSGRDVGAANEGGVAPLIVLS